MRGSSVLIRRGIMFIGGNTGGNVGGGDRDRVCEPSGGGGVKLCGGVGIWFVSGCPSI